MKVSTHVIIWVSPLLGNIRLVMMDNGTLALIVPQ